MPPDALIRQAELTIAHGSKSFAAAARLFRPAMRRDVMLLYTWCRYCDDLADGQQLGHGRQAPASLEAIAQLRRDSLAAAAGEPDDSVPMRALAEVCRQHAIERNVIADHIEGFRHDAAGWRPDTLEHLLHYSYCVAGTVGVMMARIMGVADRATLARACDLGLAFQLTNIARDVLDDARSGRCYLPGDWLSEAGLVRDLPPGTALHPGVHEQIWPLVARLIESAEPYYASARTGIRALPSRAAWAIAAALEIYRDIGRGMLARGPAALAQRSHTSAPRKLWRMLMASPVMLRHRTRPLVDRRDRTLWTPDSLARVAATSRSS